MSINLNQLVDNVEYNILLIGRTGQGKSTFVNSFANYLKYANLDEAIKEGAEEVIATKFELEKTDRHISIASGNDDNEVDTEFYLENYTQTRKPRVYSFGYINKLIRLIDTPGLKWDDYSVTTNESLHVISQCLVNISKVHAIMLVTDHFDLDLYELSLLQSIHQNASTNVIFCCTKDGNYGNHRFEILTSSIQILTKITPNFGQNLLTIDNCAYQCLIARKQQHTFSEDQMSGYRESWNDASEQIQSMLDWCARIESCEATNVLESMRHLQIMNLCWRLVFYYNITSKPIKIGRIMGLVQRDRTEYAKIESICAKLWTMVINSSVVEWHGFEVMIGKYKYNYNIKNVFTKLTHLDLNHEAQCSPNNFQELFTELKGLKHSGSYFTKQLNKITKNGSNKNKIKEIPFRINCQNISTIRENITGHRKVIDKNLEMYQANAGRLAQLRQILSLVTENNLLLINTKEVPSESKHISISNHSSSSSTTKYDLSNASLENVVFTCDKSSSTIRDFIVKQTNTTSQSDTEYILQNLDQLIKSNFNDIIPFIKHYSPVQKLIEDKQNKTTGSLEENSIKESASKNLDLQNTRFSDSSYIRIHAMPPKSPSLLSKLRLPWLSPK